MSEQAPPAEATAIAAAMNDTLSNTVSGIESLSFMQDEPQKTAPTPPPAAVKQEPKPEAKAEPVAKETPTEATADAGDIEIPESILPKDKKGKDAKDTETGEIDPDSIPDKPPGKYKAGDEIGWRELKGQVKTLAQEKEALQQTYEQRIAELEEKASKISEFEDKAKKFEEAERELVIHKIEASQEFKEQIDAPLTAISNRMTAIAKKFEIDPKEFAAALEEPDFDVRADKLDEIMTGMNSIYQDEVRQMARDTQEILAKETKLRERAKEAQGQLAKINGEKTAAQQAEHDKNFKATVTKTIKDFSAKIPFVPIEDGETSEAVFAAIEKDAKSSSFDSANPAVQAFSVAAALTLKRVNAQLRHVLEESNKKDARLAEYAQSTPSARTSQQAAASVAEGPGWYPGKF